MNQSEAPKFTVEMNCVAIKTVLPPPDMYNIILAIGGDRQHIKHDTDFRSVTGYMDSEGEWKTG